MSRVADILSAEDGRGPEDPRTRFEDPQEIVDATDAPYEARLQALQRWRRLVVEEDGQGGEAEKAVSAAIQALETGAELEQDEPEERPPGRGYGVVRDK